MKVIGYDPFLTESRAKALGIELVTELDSLYRDADFITVHMPVTEQTRGMLNSAAFARMKPKVCIVNCARGEIIVENDLLAALDSGKIGAAALDVYAEEPLAADHPFRKHAGITLTPHLGASTAEAQEKCGIEVAEVIAGYLLTGEVRNAVNLPYLDAKTYEQVKPYLTLGEKLGKLLSQLSTSPVDRLHVTYGGKAQELPNIDPITRAILIGFLSLGRGQRPEQCERSQHRFPPSASPWRKNVPVSRSPLTSGSMCRFFAAREKVACRRWDVFWFCRITRASSGFSASRRKLCRTAWCCY